ncbi:class I SAM-dependent methyltransferase [Bacillus dakarensis]|uniref:class I SAM-dependent methyltransferase n=1 Tax=Robertmurraya dakarensis TaxID=1926278 RepID=UPI000981355A|nr:class I SAM-dependent methyltransferase [Bacillus dakarensis]
MFVTTAGRTDDEMIHKAKGIALSLNVSYIDRKKRSIISMQEIQEDDCLVVGKERIELYPLGEKQPFFFHPNSSMFRIKRLMDGDHDPFVDATGMVEGKTLLDCTLGLASDSIVASCVAGEAGKIVGIEGSQYLSYIVREGLLNWDSGISEMNEAMRRIQVIPKRSLDYMKELEDNSFDCVYFDPMFEERILESDGIIGLSRFALYEDITDELIGHALRIATDRIVLKDHFRSRRFEKFGFQVQRRKTAKFHFGIIEK